MTTVITPASGAAPLFTQQGVGTTPGYSALDDRRSNSGSLQEGVYGTSTLVTAGGVANVANADFMVTQRNAGANLSVDINMPAGGFALVQGDTIAGQGLYGVPVHSATINEAVAAADPTNPRVDSVILEIQDNVLDGTAGNLARTRILTGTPNGSATLSNRTGAPALPGSALLLADLLVAAAGSSVPNSNIRDRRKWARGASLTLKGSNGGDFTTTSTSLTSLAAGAFDTRLECSGVPLLIALVGQGSHSVAGSGIQFSISQDGSVVENAQVTCSTASGAVPGILTYGFIPAAGSHSFAWNWAAVGAGTITLRNASTLLPVITYREDVRQSTANNTVTTG